MVVVNCYILASVTLREVRCLRGCFKNILLHAEGRSRATKLTKLRGSNPQFNFLLYLHGNVFEINRLYFIFVCNLENERGRGNKLRNMNWPILPYLKKETISWTNTISQACSRVQRENFSSVKVFLVPENIKKWFSGITANCLCLTTSVNSVRLAGSL